MKKLFALIIALALAVALCSCEPSKENPDVPPPGETGGSIELPIVPLD